MSGLNGFRIFSFCSALLCVLVTAGCASSVDKGVTADESAPLVLKQARFDELPGWTEDTVLEALPAMRLSCARILKNAPDKPFGTGLKAGMTYGDFGAACREIATADFSTDAQMRAFIERYFTPYAVYAGQSPDGLFTGYYEATLHGSRTRTDTYRYPLHARPDDLVMVDLGAFREELKGQRIAGRVRDGQLKPYEDRASIVKGAWPHNDRVLVWVDNPVDAFFVQVQGSGAVRLTDGSVMRIGYAGQNGHPYYAIGRELIARGELTKENVSMQSIRAWLAAHPDKADEVMNTNKSYVFFEEKKDGGAIGAEGVALTAGRSLAVDSSRFPYGFPVWLQTDVPALDRLMVAQDTGGAIRGAVRGDVFWGLGDTAEKTAGAMKAKGRYWAILPR